MNTMRERQAKIVSESTHASPTNGVGGEASRKSVAESNARREVCIAAQGLNACRRREQLCFGRVKPRRFFTRTQRRDRSDRMNKHNLAAFWPMDLDGL